MELENDGLTFPRQPWKRLALCNGMDPSFFFPTTEREEISNANFCIPCPAKQDCLDWALSNKQEDGIWGGLTERQRKRYRRKWLRAKLQTAS